MAVQAKRCVKRTVRLRLGVAPRRVAGPTRQAEAAGLHPPADEGLHFAQLVRARIAIGRAHDILSDGTVGHQLPHVHTEPVFEQGVLLCRQVHGPTAVRSDDDGGDALRQQRLGGTQRLGREPLRGVGAYVDKAVCKMRRFPISARRQPSTAGDFEVRGD